MGFFKDFKAFISKGNIVDMAVGVVVGGAFGKITTSLVSDIINPAIGLVTNTQDLASWTITLREEVLDEAGEIVNPAVLMNIGKFCATILDFIIIALSIFCVLRVLMKLKKASENISNKIGEGIHGEKEEDKKDEEAK